MSTCESSPLALLSGDDRRQQGEEAPPTADEVLGALATHDTRVLTTTEARTLAGNISLATWTRIEAKGEGPPKVWLSPRRKGYPLGAFKAWLASRGVPARVAA